MKYTVLKRIATVGACAALLTATTVSAQGGQTYQVRRPVCYQF